MLASLWLPSWQVTVEYQTGPEVGRFVGVAYTALAQELDGSGVTANVLVPGGAADTRLVPRAMAPDRSQLIPPEVMVAPLVWLCSAGSDGINGQRFIAMRWDVSLPAAEAAKKAGAPAAWQQLGRQAIMPERMR